MNDKQKKLATALALDKARTRMDLDKALHKAGTDADKAWTALEKARAEWDKASVEWQKGMKEINENPSQSF